MNGLDGNERWRNLKQRLGLKGMGCCGAICSPRTPSISIIEELDREDRNTQQLINNVGQVPVEQSTTVNHRGEISTASGMNLAMALASERNLRGGQQNEGPTEAGNFKTLKRLIEETEGVDWKKKKKKMRDIDGGGGGNDWVCCVCMERNKGAAFIPCGHAFCRVCSRELWLNRGSCPICNRSILGILDIF